jgi:hypothetical protein
MPVQILDQLVGSGRQGFSIGGRSTGSRPGVFAPPLA